MYRFLLQRLSMRFPMCLDLWPFMSGRSNDVSDHASIPKWRKCWQVEKEVVEEERLAGAMRLCFSVLMTHLTAHREKALRQH